LSPAERSPLAVAERVVELVGDRAEAQVRVDSGRSALTRFANSFIHQNVGEDRLGVSLKLAAGGRVASSATTEADDDGLRRLVENTLAAARLRPVDSDWPGLAPPAPVPDVDHYDPATEAADPADRAGRVAAFVTAGPELAAAGYCDTEGGTAAFANSAGQRAEGRSSRATLDGIHQSDDSAGSAHQTASRLALLDGDAAGREAAERARRSRNAVELDPDEYEVVLEPECVATIAVFLAYYGFNAKQVEEGQSGIRLGEQQFDPAFSVWDDATDSDALGVAFDVDGTPKRRVDLISAGVPTALAHDRRTAAKAGTESTGHAIPGGDSGGAFPINMFVASGAPSTADLVASVDRGLLVTTFNYCRILDPKTMVVTGLTRNGTFLIEGGEVRTGVRNLRFTQSFLEALAPGRVLAVSGPARFADSEFGAGIVRAPSLRLASWRFTGGGSR
jgi:predicted Zn-dependent protease